MEYWLQIGANGLISGGTYGLSALGFSLIFGRLRVVNMAHGVTCTLGGYAGYVISAVLGWPVWLGLPAALLAGAAFGAVVKEIAFRPLPDAASLRPIVSGLACTMVAENLLAAAFGHEARSFREGNARSYACLGASITGTQMQILLTCGGLVGLLYLFLQRTDLGRQMIAASDDQEAAASWGINGEWVSALACTLGSALAGAAGYLIALDLDLDPYMGTGLLFTAFTSSLLFRTGSLPGAVAGGLLLGVLQNLVAAFISTQYKSASTFFVLILILLWRPRGPVLVPDAKE